MQAPRVSLRLRMPGDHRMRRVLLAYALCDLIEFATWMAVVLVAYDRAGACRRRGCVPGDAAAGHRDRSADRGVR